MSRFMSPYDREFEELAKERKEAYQLGYKDGKKETLDKLRAEITDCLKALDKIEKSGLNIYLSNKMSGRRLTYQQCLEFIDKYKSEIEPQESEDQE